MYKINGNIWIETENKIFVSENQAILLREISKTGSITKASRAMKISYRHAWELIDSINSLSEKPVVIALTGGRGGGGTKLTSYGENIIRLFNKTHKQFLSFAKKQSEKIKSSSL